MARLGGCVSIRARFAPHDTKGARNYLLESQLDDVEEAPGDGLVSGSD